MSKQCSNRKLMCHIEFAIVILCLPFQMAFGEDLPDTISFFCNASKSEVTLNVEEQSPNLKKTGFKKETINWATLLEFGLEKNGRGQPLKSGSKIAVSRCGMIQIRIESGFINDDPQGQSGALDFPIIELRIGERTVLQRTALAVCSVNDKRANIYFGICPSYWAQSIQTRMLSDGSVEAELKRKYEDKNNETKETIEKQRIF